MASTPKAITKLKSRLKSTRKSKITTNTLLTTSITTTTATLISAAAESISIPGKVEISPPPAPGEGKHRLKNLKRKRKNKGGKVLRREKAEVEKEDKRERLTSDADKGGENVALDVNVDEEMREDGEESGGDDDISDVEGIEQDDEGDAALDTDENQHNSQSKHSQKDSIDIDPQSQNQSQTQNQSQSENNTPTQKTKKSKSKSKSRSKSKNDQKSPSSPQIIKITARELDNNTDPSSCYYYHLRMLLHPPQPPTNLHPDNQPDLLTWRTILTASLTKLLGVQGSAYLIDILKLEQWDCWVKVVSPPACGGFGSGRRSAEGGYGFAAAVGGYIGVWGKYDGGGAGVEGGGDVSVSVRVVRGGRWLLGIVEDRDGDGEKDLWGM